MRVLVATDLSNGAEVALREAARFATESDALAVVHVVPEPGLVRRLVRRHVAHAPESDTLRETALAKMREQIARVTDRPIETFVEVGADYAEIIKRAEAWGAELVVIGNHGTSGLARVVGHVAERVARHAHCDVLVARASAGRGWVLAATDLSQPSYPAITGGADQARRRRARLEVVHAVGLLDAEASYLVALGTPVLPVYGQDAEAPTLLLSSVMNRLQVDGRGKILERPATGGIVAEAESLGAELIVLGARGRTGLLRSMLGRVAEKVLHAAPCSVMLARPHAA
jgi:nucleotide-binding universal stress UspA family protein